MTNLTDHLTKLTCAASTARDLGCDHTVRALDRMIVEEKAHLEAAKKSQRSFISLAALEGETSA